ncbi:MAG TPA: disulfide isomerase DsbC N-terminal domain-containing protein [Dissulfurispiraceae bacterium]
MRRMKFVLSLFIILVLSHIYSTNALAFTADGCSGDCRKCHSITTEEVNRILKKMNHADVKVLGIRQSPVKSLWEVAIDEGGKRGIFYIDYSKKFLIPGPILEASTNSNVTAESLEKMRKVNPSRIPLADALVMGNRHAKKKVVVFTDPG